MQTAVEYFVHLVRPLIRQNEVFGCFRLDRVRLRRSADSAPMVKGDPEEGEQHKAPNHGAND